MRSIVPYQPQYPEIIEAPCTPAGVGPADFPVLAEPPSATIRAMVREGVEEFSVTDERVVGGLFGVTTQTGRRVTYSIKR